MVRNGTRVKDQDTYQNPYIEQQLPFFQSPQTVLPLEEPQVPSVVTAAVAVAPEAIVVETRLITGSWLVEVVVVPGAIVVETMPITVSWLVEVAGLVPD